MTNEDAASLLASSKCGAYKEYQTSRRGCLLPRGHEGDHSGDDLDLLFLAAQQPFGSDT